MFNLNDRDFDVNQTILSGDIGTPDEAADNCYHVVCGEGVGDQARLDGVVVTRGIANRSVFPTNSGGGIFLDGGSTVAIINCLIEMNDAYAGGGPVC